MEKKTQVITILDSLKNTWDLARWCKIIIENTETNETIIEMLIDVFQNTIIKIQDITTKNKLKEARNLLQWLKWEINHKAFTI